MIWMRMVSQSISNLMTETLQRRSSRILCFLANETVAEDYYWQEIPFVYRAHEAPDEEKMQTLATFINNFGYLYAYAGANESPKEIQKLLGKVEGTPEEAMISRLALRSMKQARYTPENDGHFGLAAKYYTHFTSPIRVIRIFRSTGSSKIICEDE